MAVQLLGMVLASAAHANTADQVMFSVPPKVAVKHLSASPGEQTFLIASNAPFSVVADGMIGELEVEIVSSGMAEGQSFGSRSQFPALAGRCRMVSSMHGQAIYTSDRKTAHNRGSLLQQAVMVIVRHDDIASPQIRIEAGQTAPPANPCA